MIAAVFSVLDDKYCVDSDADGEVKMLFEGREWLYVATIDYVIE